MNIPVFSLVYIIIVILVCIKILFDTKTSTKALSYIVLVIAFPILGIIIYFAVGVNYRKQKIYQKKLEIDENSFPELEDRVREASRETLHEKRAALGHFYSLATYAAEDNLLSDNNEVTLLTNGENKFPAFIESLKAAKHHIHLEYYIYEDDDIGTEIGELLMEKARQGVQVRFIYDDFGSKAIRKNFIQRLREAGVEAVPFYEINLIYFASRMNYRNHRKILVIDGTAGYVGGINVSDKYYNNGKKELFWRDTHLKITGMSVLNLQYIFLTDWNFCANQAIEFSTDYFPVEQRSNHFGDKLVQVSVSGPDSEQPSIMYNLMQAIMLARKEVLITTPYFIPEKSFTDALKIAHLSGADVKIIVPDKSDSVFVNAACNSYYQDLLEMGIEIYRYQKGFVHAKTMVCDEYVSIVGTANLDNRSFDLNFEVNAIVYDHELALQMKENFNNDLAVCRQMNFEQWKARPLLIRVFEKVVHLFSPLL